MRYMLIKTSAENVVTFKKPKVEAMRNTVSVDDVVFSEEELAAANEDVADESSDDLKEQHEKLPDLQEDMSTETPSETVEA